MSVTTSASLAGLFFTIVFGVPVPEDVALCSAGLMAATGQWPTPAVFLVAWSAIITGDSIQYWVGRRWGAKVIALPWIQRRLPAERRARFEAQLQRWGPLACFGIRFLPGARIPGYLLAGASRVPPLGFLGLDGVAAAVSTSFWLFGTHQLAGPVRNLAIWISENRGSATCLAVVALAGFAGWRCQKPSATGTGTGTEASARPDSNSRPTHERSTRY